MYPGTEKDVINGLTTSFSIGWTGIVGPNGCGKSTLMTLLTGKLQPTAGSIGGIKATSYHCQQETNSPPVELDEFRDSYDKDVLRWKGSLGLFELEATSWDHLSHGERKRMQLGLALSRRPELLMLDEPTNHLDAENRDFIIQTLKQYKGIGILVSHDRELLDALCTRCVIYHGGRAMTVSGNYSEASQNVSQDVRSKEKKALDLKTVANSMKREVQRISEVNQGSKNRISKRGLSPKNHDAKSKINKARLTNKDSTLSQKKINMERRLEKTKEEISTLRTAKSYADSIFFGDETKHNKTLLLQESIKLDLAGVTLELPELVIQSGDKIGLTGLNGTGKSSLIHWLLNNQKFKNCELFYLSQELGDNEKLLLLQKFERCEKEDYSKCLQIIARLGSDAKQIIGGNNLSSGEIRKVAIALAIVQNIDLLILDEPTNHLDLHSVHNLESALAQSNLAVLLVSHDQHFLDATCTVNWHLEKDEDSVSRCTITSQAHPDM